MGACDALVERAISDGSARGTWMVLALAYGMKQTTRRSRRIPGTSLERRPAQLYDRGQLDSQET